MDILKLVITSALIGTSHSIISLTSREPTEKSLGAYFKAIKRCGLSSCLYTFDSSTYGNIFVEGCSVIIVNKFDGIKNSYTRFQLDNFFVLVERLKDVSYYAQHLKPILLCNSKAIIHFIIKEFNVEPENLLAVFNQLWTFRIRNAVIVKIDNTQYQAFSYEPFGNKTKKLVNDNKFCKNIYDKPLNLDKQALRIAYVARKPHFYKDEYGKFVGADKMIFDMFAYFLNASLGIEIWSNMSDLKTNLINAVNEGHIDIIGNRIIHIQVPYLKNMDHSIPISRNDKYFIVPKPQKIPVDILIIFAFTQAVWAALLITIFVLTVVVCIVQKESLNNSFMTVWGFLLGVPLTMFNSKSRFRHVLILWIFGSYILSSCFQANLMRSFIATKYKKRIQTLDDLKDSGLKIGIMEYYVNCLKETKDLTVKEKYVAMEEEEIIDKVLRGDISHAYFMGKDLAEYLIHKCDKVNCGGRAFEIMPQATLPADAVYHLQKDSYLTAQLDKFILLLQSSGLMERSNPWSNDIEQKENILKMSHLTAAFKLLLFGYILSISVLILEIITWKYNK